MLPKWIPQSFGVFEQQRTHYQAMRICGHASLSLFLTNAQLYGSSSHQEGLRILSHGLSIPTDISGYGLIGFDWHVITIEVAVSKQIRQDSGSIW